MRVCENACENVCGWVWVGVGVVGRCGCVQKTESIQTQALRLEGVKHSQVVTPTPVLT